jgi:uncharacterized membrane protein
LSIWINSSFISEATSAALTHAFAYFEISVALNHDVDELLVGILAEIKESVASNASIITDRTSMNAAASMNVDESIEFVSSKKKHSIGGSSNEDEKFHAAIRRFSQRKKKQMTPSSGDKSTTKCASLTPAGLIDRFRAWRRRESRSCDQMSH